ncbi:MAG: sigma-70 family RNA polymerase sigma factor, partial [Pirellulales bacterium]
HTPDTEELVRHAAEGDTSAVQALFETHRGRLAQMLQVRMDPRLRGRIDPSDVIQETLIAASQKMAQYFIERPLPFYPWLRQIAWEKLVHLHDRHLRASKRSVTREQALRPEISDESALGLAEQFIGSVSRPSAAILRRELRDRVRQALEDLAAEDREVLLLRYLEQMSSKEIAAIMDRSEGAINMQHMRALERMRKILSPDQGEV